MIARLAALALALCTALPAAAADSKLVPGGGGLPIAMREWGNPAGPAIVLIHGAGFAKEYWAPQEHDAALAARFHFVSYDLRGHGASGKPWRVEDMGDTALWADDLAAVIAAAKLDRPTIVAWSMGGYAALDYVRKFGTRSLSGLMLVSSTGGLVPALKVTRGTDYAQANADLMSPDLATFARGADAILGFMTAKPLSPETRASWSAQERSLPVATRAAMRTFRLDNADQAAALALPVAFVVGERDRAMPVAALRTLAARLPHAGVTVVAGAGHTVSADATIQFDRLLSGFVAEATGTKP